jgi:CRP-like cAMP-binding protein
MSTFDDLMGEVMATADRFGHREHMKLTWLAVRRCGTTAAVELISDGIQRTARYAGVPQKYNSTVSRAWVELTAYHMAEAPAETFDELLRRNPGLMDKRLLTRFYHSRTLASPAARCGWVEPDLHAFPR